MQKMRKETETDENRLFCHIFVIGNISIGAGGGIPGPPGYAYGQGAQAPLN